MSPEKEEACPRCGTTGDAWDYDQQQCKSSASPTCSTATVVTDGMHIRAVKKAVELGMLPKHVDEATYLKNWSAMREILEAALSR